MKDVLTVVREPSPWQIDERAHAGPEHLHSEYVAAYDQKSPTDWSEDIAELRALGIGPASTVVDIGAGTGAFARADGTKIVFDLASFKAGHEVETIYTANADGSGVTQVTRGDGRTTHRIGVANTEAHCALVQPARVQLALLDP